MVSNGLIIVLMVDGFKVLANNSNGGSDGGEPNR